MTAATRPASTAGDLTVVFLLGRLLDRMERSSVPVNPVQYRSVVQHLSRELEALRPGPALDALLGQLPATAELYENLRYAQAGLCRSPLDRAVDAERRTREALARIARV